MNGDNIVRSCDSSMAVRLSNGFKSFREGTPLTKKLSSVTVLENFNLNVPRGSLYSLLGSSGCGKTTVISIIMGLCEMEKGKLEISTSSRALGYMPQETCLYSEFSISETLYYFGTLFGICDSNTKINNFFKLRINYLRNLLLLPPEERIVGTLSGGQKRRLSLAVALVHQPEILLLDEPTSGVDPLVRELIWDHLTYLASTKGTTIILTTHYVDEAKGSNIVGFMRNGQLIAEYTPSNLYETNHANSMETVFLALCQQHTSQQIALPSSPNSSGIHGSRSSQAFYLKGSIRRIHVLVGKNYKCLIRNLWMLLFITATPTMCMLVTCIGFQDDPHNISLGVVNDDINGGTGNYIGCIKNDTTQDYCRAEQLSCVFLESLIGNAVKLIDFETTESATEAVEEGNIWGFIHFSKNYTNALTNRVLMGTSSYFDEDDAGKAEWNDSKIILRLDQTNTLIYGKIKTIMYEALENSSKIILKSCGYDERIAEFPLQYMNPIIGEKKMTSLKYVGPSLAIELTYFFSLTTAIRFISEKRDGTLERSIAGGAQNWEILISYAIAQSPVLLLQSILVILVLQFGFSLVSYLSTLPLILALCMLQGLSGLAVGLLLALFCGDESQAAIGIIALVLPNAFISGLLWPLEGLPNIIQELSLYLPMTLSGEAVRSLMIRGWGFSHPHVWQGFLITTAYFVVVSILVIMLIGRQLRR